MEIVVRKGDHPGLFILALELAPPTSHSVSRYGRHWLSHGLHVERCWRFRFTVLFWLDVGQVTSKQRGRRCDGNVGL